MKKTERKPRSFTQSLHGAPEKLFFDFDGNVTPIPESLFVEVRTLYAAVCVAYTDAHLQYDF